MAAGKRCREYLEQPEGKGGGCRWHHVAALTSRANLAQLPGTVGNCPEWQPVGRRAAVRKSLEKMENLSRIQLQQLQEKGISPEKLQGQVESFKKGFPFARIVSAAVEKDGVDCFGPEEIEFYRRLYRRQAGEEKILKFVPASGAATRMFKGLYSCYQSLKDGKPPVMDAGAAEFFEKLPRFAFQEPLRAAVKAIYGLELDDCLTRKDYFPVLDALLENPEGLCYGRLPKALLLFHSYPEGNRMAVEEHLVEAALYASSQGVCRLHFTLSPEHRERFEACVAEALPRYEKRYGFRYEVSYSEQKPSTDTVAVTLDNEILSDEQGKLVFRPGGHGALIENLNEVDATLVFIKNIDNVTTDALRQDTIVYKELLAGVLLERREAAFGFLRRLEREELSEGLLKEVRAFACGKLGLRLPPGKERLSLEAQKEYFKDLLDRPLRVCGVVRNEGEPGGGPFWVQAQGAETPSLQIVESSQVDMADAGQKRIFETSRFFNPVDLVCSLQDYRNRKFDLARYVDPSTAFIARKSFKGKEIKAMELPGLWNGAMAGWNTLFVEVPQSVFTPVKTVNDLLRPQHQQ